jgi:exosortase K
MITKSLKTLSAFSIDEIRKWTIVFTAGALVFVMKYLHAKAGTEELLFILQPTSFAVQVFQNASSEFIPEKGFVFPDIDIVIDKSCAGGNFLILCFSVLIVSVFLNLNKKNLGWFLIPALLIVAWLMAIITNVIRINTAIFSLKLKTQWPVTASPWFHEMQGAIIYLTFLILIFSGANFTIKKLNRS